MHLNSSCEAWLAYIYTVYSLNKQCQKQIYPRGKYVHVNENSHQGKFTAGQICPKSRGGVNLSWLHVSHVNEIPDLPPGVYQILSGFDVKYQQIKQLWGKENVSFTFLLINILKNNFISRETTV